MSGARALFLLLLSAVAGCRKAPPEAMRLVEAGESWMGAPRKEEDKDDDPRHKVYLSAYYIDPRPVSAGEYRAFAREAGRELWEQPPGRRDSDPAVFVSWDDARAYCESRAKRLPTEAEWEKAGLSVDHGEWVADWYAPDYYPKSPERDPRGPSEGQARAFRGGTPADPPEARTPWARRKLDPARRLGFLSFRCAKSAIVY